MRENEEVREAAAPAAWLVEEDVLLKLVFNGLAMLDKLEGGGRVVLLGGSGVGGRAGSTASAAIPCFSSSSSSTICAQDDLVALLVSLDWRILFDGDGCGGREEVICLESLGRPRLRPPTTVKPSSSRFAAAVLVGDLDVSSSLLFWFGEAGGVPSLGLFRCGEAEGSLGADSAAVVVADSSQAGIALVAEDCDALA